MFCSLTGDHIQVVYKDLPLVMLMELLCLVSMED
jgi:hypothetical protein